MVTRTMVRGAVWAFLILGLLVSLASPGFSHSGGTDENGCHAGSQPYHCHGGGSGGGSGGGGGTAAPSGPTAAERAAAAEKQAKIAATQAKLAQARASYAQTKPLAQKLEKRSLVAEEKLDDRTIDVENLQADVDSQHEEAASLRQARIAERDQAAQRIKLVKNENIAARDAFEDTLLAIIFAAGLFGGFLLYGIAKFVAGLVWSTAGRIVITVTGLGAAFAILGLISPSVSLGWGILPAALSGLTLSFVFMLVRAWWVTVTMPAMVTITFVGIAALVAAAAIASAATMAPPPAEQPAQTDQAMAEEAEADPTAEGLDEAQVVDAAADELEPEVEKLESDLADFQSKVEALTEKAEDARAEADKDLEAIRSAKVKLASLS